MLMMFLFACELGLTPANPAYLNQNDEIVSEASWMPNGSENVTSLEEDASSLSVSEESDEDQEE